MPVQMPGLPRTFSDHLARVQQTRRNERMAQFDDLRMQTAERALQDDQTVRGLMQQYGGDYGQMAGAAAAAGVAPDTVASLYDRANAVEDRATKKKSDELAFAVKGLEYVQATAPRITDQAGWDAALQDWQAKGLVNPGELPAEYKPEHVQRLAKRADQKLKTISYQQGDQKVTELLDEATGERTRLGTGPAFAPTDRETWGAEEIDPVTGERIQRSTRGKVSRTKPPDGGKPLTGTFGDAVKSLGEVVTDESGEVVTDEYGVQKIFTPPKTIADFQDWAAQQEGAGTTFKSWTDAAAKYRESQRAPVGGNADYIYIPGKGLTKAGGPAPAAPMGAEGTPAFDPSLVPPGTAAPTAGAAAPAEPTPARQDPALDELLSNIEAKGGWGKVDPQNAASYIGQLQAAMPKMTAAQRERAQAAIKKLTMAAQGQPPAGLSLANLMRLVTPAR